MPATTVCRAMTVTVERNDSVAILTIDRPEQRNTLSAGVADALRAELDGLGETATKAVLVRGAGETFCAGGDISSHLEYAQGEIDQATWADRQARTADAVAALYDCPLPTVAAVDGPAFSEGACLALACDIRLGSPDAKVGFGFRRFGQAAAAGATYLLSRAVDPDVAAELLYTGDLIDAERASTVGLLTRVVSGEQFDDAVASLVSQLATGPTAGTQAAKRLLRKEYGTLSAAIDGEQQVQRKLAETAAFREGVEAFRKQRDPHFGLQ